MTALLVAAAGFVVAARAFQEGGPVARETSTPAEARIVFSAGRGEQIDLFSMKPDGSDVRRLTDTPSSEDQPASSPDGSRLAFAAREPGEPASYVVGVMDADGSDRAEIPGTRLEGGNPVGDPAWSPDAAAIAFTAYGDGGGIYVTDVGGGPPRRLTEAGPPTIYVDSDPEWSPNGDSIAFIRWVLGDATEQPAYEILQVPATGGDTTLVARVAAPTEENPNRGVFDGLSWSPDGSRLAFAMDGAIHTIDPVGGEPVEVVSCEELGCVDGTDVITDATAWSPDGLRIAFTAWSNVPSARDEPPIIYVAAPFADGAAVVSTDVGGLSPAWQRVHQVEAAPPAPDATIGETIEVGQATALVAAAGSVWVSTFQGGSEDLPSVLRIDERSGDVIARISVEAIPDSEVGGEGMVFDGRFVWMVGTEFDENGPERGVLVRIDPELNAAETIDLGVGLADSSLVFDGQSLWTTGVAAPGRDPQVIRIDPTTGGVISEIPIDAEWWGALVAIEGALWLVEADNGGDDPALVQLDPESGEQRLSVPLEDGHGVQSSTGPAAGGGVIWAVTGSEILGVLPDDGEVVSRFSADVGFDLEVGEDGSVWFLGQWVSLHRLDPVTGSYDTPIDLGRGSEPTAITVGPAAIWVLDYKGTVTKIGLT